jgi:hypothetical protein
MSSLGYTASKNDNMSDRRHIAINEWETFSLLQQQNWQFIKLIKKILAVFLGPLPLPGPPAAAVAAVG